MFGAFAIAHVALFDFSFGIINSPSGPAAARAAASATPWQPTSLKTTLDGFNNLGVSNSSTAALKKRRGFFNFSDSCWSASSSILRSIDTMIATLSGQRVCLDKVVLTRSNTSSVVTFRSQPIPTARHSGL